MVIELYKRDGNLLDGKFDFFPDENASYVNASIDDTNFQSQSAPFTKRFTIPASANNNILLEMFGQPDIINSINPHKKIPAYLIIEDTHSIKGDLELSGFVYKEGEIAQYTIGFFEEQFDIKTVLADYRLSEIDQDDFTYTLNWTNVYNSWNGTGSVFIPVMSHVHDYLYQPDAPLYDIRNIAPVTTGVTQSGVILQDLKPAYNIVDFVTNILENSTFVALGYDFTVAWDTKIDTYLDGAFFIPSRDAGEIQGGLLHEDYLTHVKNSTHSAGNIAMTFPTVLNDPNTNWKVAPNNYYLAYLSGLYAFALSAWENVVTGCTATLTMTAKNKVTGDILAEQTIYCDGGVEVLSMFLEKGDQVEFYLTGAPAAKAYTTNLTSTDFPLTYWNNDITADLVLPDMNCHEFVRNFLDTFNLVLDINGNDITIVDRLSYYENGEQKDFSQYIDYKNRSYGKLPVDDVINMKYFEAEDKQNVVYKNLAGKFFGELNAYADVDFNSGDNDVESIFTIFPPALLNIINGKGQPTDQFTTIPIHSQFDMEENQVNSDFILFFYRGVNLAGTTYSIQKSIDGDNNPVFTSTTEFPICTFDTSAVTANALSYSLENSLDGSPRVGTNYATFFADWLAVNYSPDARTVKLTAYIPVTEILNLRLNDILFIDGYVHIIKKIVYDWLTTKAKMELYKIDISVRATKPDSIDDFGNITYSDTPTKQDQRTWNSRTTAPTTYRWELTGKGSDVSLHKTKNVPTDYAMRWRGNYDSAIPPFDKFDVIQDDGWVMIANTETYDRPAPQKTSEPFWASGLGVTPSWSTTSATVNIQYTGSRYTFANDGYISDFRVWIPAVSASIKYQVILIKDPTGTPLTTYQQPFIPTATGWYDTTIGANIVKAGEIYDIFLAVQNTSSSSTWNSTWNYMTPKTATAPKAGEITQSSDYKGYISVHKTDNTATDQSANLATVAIGDTLTIGSTTWEILTVTDNTTYITYQVTPVLQDAASGSQTATFKVYSAVSVSYVYITNHYLTNADVSGLITATDIFSPTVDNNGYGVDIEIQEADISDEYDFLSYTEEF